MNEPRVLLLIPDLCKPENLGGIQTFNRYLVQALKDLKMPTRVIAVNDRPEDGPGSVDWVPCAVGHPRLRKLKAAYEIFRALLTRKFDLVICGHLHFAPLCIPLCRAMGVPVTTLLHGVELWAPRKADIRALALSSRIACVSRYTRALVLERLPSYPPEDVLILHNTFDAARFHPLSRPSELARKLGIPEDAKVVLTVGRLTAYDKEKGYEEALRAMAQVSRNLPGVRYVLAGTGDDRERLIHLAGELGLSSSLIAPGFVPTEELVPLFNLCDVFLMPSRKEGFGIVFIEAMACGKPVVGGNLDGSMEPLCDGALGTAVDPYDPDAIAEAVLDILTGASRPQTRDPVWLRAEVVRRFGPAVFRSKVESVVRASL